MKAATLFHGGPAGLEVGDLIRPAISLGKEHPRSLHQPNYNPHRVYITQRREYAQLFAHGCAGALYEVRPVGRLLVDRDARGSFSCSAAVIVAVLDMDPPEPPAVTDALASFLRSAQCRIS